LFKLFCSNLFHATPFQRVLDYETWIFNLGSANLHGQAERPEYFKFYEAKKDLGMSALFPEDYDQLTRRLASDEDFFFKYLR
jgi:hypothetical protein